MLKLIHKMYWKDKVSIDIANSLNLQLEKIKTKINDIYKQIFLDYATWYLELNVIGFPIPKKLREMFLQISKESDKDEDN